jgi:large subunit ribosomal protein L4
MSLLLLNTCATCLTSSTVQGLNIQRATYPAAASTIRMGVPVADFKGANVGEEELSLKVAKAGAYVVHRKIVAEQANMRLGTACTKTRGEVRGGGRKPYKQKGTGNARRGSTRSPLIKGGGVTFGPKPKSYKLKMNKKEKQVAISTALMGAIPKMKVVQDFEDNFSSPKTADMRSFLERLEVDTKDREGTLMLINKRHENTYLSARNIPYLNLRALDNINARDIVKAKKVFISQSAVATLRERYGV